ncbi:hypothetical protein KV201_03735 [Shewanella sp. SR1]|uniref:hypothetical protein n=1 Tax=Shewanella sp. SR1 TaxID=2855505 RepID=UPI001CF1306B|nr:hypothetical protein [Shewanella sp. SR1]MCB2381288.1 hypothetical protein [Shewanella sp. SR1]
MGLPVTVYSWEDAGAPQLTGRTPAEFVNVLKKVLVDGYGVKAGLGWSVAFEDTILNKIAFRNSTVDGSGGYVQFWCPEGTNATNSRFSYRSAQGMSGLDNFIKPCPLGNIWAGGTPVGVQRWMVIGTVAGFYLFTLSNVYTDYNCQGTQTCVAFIGDIHSNYNNDAGRLIGFTGSSSDLTLSSAPTNVFDGLLPRLYQTDGSSAYVPGATNKTVTSQSGGSATKDDDIVLGINFATGMITITAPIPSNSTDSIGTPVNRSILQPYFRGVLPGALTSSFRGYRNKPFPQFRSINGKQHMLTADSSGSTIGCCGWLNIEEWY